MVFSSVVFIFYFLPLFLVIYYLSGARNSILLTGSAFFYVWGEGPYIILLFGLLLLNCLAGLYLEKSEGSLRKWGFALAVVANIAVLGVFKYSQFIIDIVAGIGGFAAPPVSFHLPLGISFFIFQLISYLVEVYLGTIKAEGNIVRLSTYVMMFPHLVAGPIVRYTDIKAELHDRSVGAGKLSLGIQYFVVGLCQKVMIANSVAPVADHLFLLPCTEITTATAWIGTLAYTLQIYFDFCGYSNMAIGLAFMLGFRFPKNFDYPYASRSITEFWRRWHMSLSFWFRDYVYIPLGGSRKGEASTVRNLLIVFLVTGLWHGAAWTFIFWGLFHGAFVVLERLLLKDVLAASPQLVSRSYTLAVVMVGWVFFRAENFAQASSVISALAGFGAVSEGWQPLMTWMTPETVAALVIGSLLSFPILPALFEKLGMAKISGPSLPAVRSESIAVHVIPTVVLVAGLLISITLLVSTSLNPFLYFRF